MASKVTLDALEKQKLGPEGDALSARNAKEVAARMVEEAHEAFPDGMPPTSPIAGFTRDQLLHEAARLDIRVASLFSEADLRVVMEHVRVKLTGAAAVPKLDRPSAPMQPIPPVKIRGLKESPTNRWRVDYVGDRAPTVSVGNGQMAVLRRGAIIELQHYSKQILQGMVDQGVKLIPIEEIDED